MSDSSVQPASSDISRVRSHFLVTILTLLLSILVFIPSYLLLRGELSLEQDLIYLALLMVGIIAFNLFFLVLRIQGIWQVFPFVILVSLIIVSYYLKYWQIATVGEAVAEEWQLDVGGYSTEVMLQTFEIITTGFITFCFAAVVYMLIRPRWTDVRSRAADPELTEAWGNLAQKLAILLPIVSIIIFVLLERYDIGIRGVRSVRLPFRLTGIIYYVTVVVVPALQLLLIHAAHQSQKMNPLRYPLLLLIVYNFTLTVIFASRGHFLYGMLAAFFLIGTYPEYRRRSVGILLGAIVITSLIFGLITDYRYLLVGARGSTILAIESLLDENLAQDSSSLISGTALVFSRIIGANSLMVISSRLIEPLGLRNVINEGFDLSRYYTNVMLGISADRTHRAAPSLFGWFYLAGGLWAVWLGIMVFTIGTGAMWDILHKLEDNGWLAMPVIQSLFLVNLIQVGTDGGLHRSWTLVLAMAATVLLTKLITGRLQVHRTKLDAVAN